jgi:hypothetical protein
MKIKLNTPIDILDALHALTDGRGKTAKVSKSVLDNLLIDHHRMVKALQAQGIQVSSLSMDKFDALHETQQSARQPDLLEAH